MVPNQYRLIFLRDNNDAIYGFKYYKYVSSTDTYNYNQTYYYETNLQGDVIAIYNASGNLYATYKYDAWGKLLGVYDASGDAITSSSDIAIMNPIRYRGYIYDTETGFYYLQSRYYDPEVGRFINLDAYVNANGDFIGYNMYAYCGNNPISRTDTTGEAWYHWAIAAAVVVGCAAATVVTCGGFAAAASAVVMVGSGVAAATTASTIAAGAFIGSATCLGTAVIYAASESNSVEEFCDYGSNELVLNTFLGGVSGGIQAYSYCGTPNPSRRGYKGQQLAEKSVNTNGVISAEDARRIQNAANRTNQSITVVGSRAAGTAGPYSDWDYILSGNSAQRHSAASSLPAGVAGGANNSGIDIFSSYPFSPHRTVLDPTRPHITFNPQ